MGLGDKLGTDIANSAKATEAAAEGRVRVWWSKHRETVIAVAIVVVIALVVHYAHR